MKIKVGIPRSLLYYYYKDLWKSFFEYLNIEVVESNVSNKKILEDGEKLTKHIKGKLSECTDVIVVLSEQTKKSWWVPFEIGMATQKDMPIANYLLSAQTLPDYLEFWPRLKNRRDILMYVETRKQIANQVLQERAFSHGAYQYANQESEVQKFYSELKRKL